MLYTISEMDLSEFFIKSLPISSFICRMYSFTDFEYKSLNPACSFFGVNPNLVDNVFIDI